MKKIVKFALPMVLLALTLGACGSGSSSGSSAKKDVTFYLSGDTSEGGAYTKMAKKYEKETGTRVRITDVPYDDLKTKIDKSVQAKDEPDLARVAGVSSTWTKDLQNLGSIAKSAKTINSMTITDSKTKQVVAIPSDLTTNGLFINKTLFDKAGVKYPASDKDIWTWDDFLAAVKKVQASTGAKYGLVVDPSDQRLRTITYQYGGKDFRLNKAGTSYVTDANTKNALKKFISWNDNKLMPKTVWTSGEDPSSMFKSGQVAAYLSGSWQITDFSKNIKDFKWAATYMPYVKTRATNLGGNFVISFKNGKNPSGGMKFLKWLYKPANYKQLCEYAGYIPAVEDLDIDYGSNQKAYDIMLNEIANSSSIAGYQETKGVEAVMKGYKGLSGSYKDEIANVISGQESFNAALKKIEQDYNDGFLNQK
ncbi:ABC transporter substrate-binding protein [Lacticaseibacillus paracasei]|uniref:ABC transporter substrate-binding protein n=1 Tax=Lacticaseibacillus paracasei TaxID=1597 RepID=UPI0039FD2C1A